MTFVLLVAGLAMLGLAGALLFFGLPKNGHVRPVAVGTTGEFYTFAIILSAAISLALILDGLL
jgi:hypothetical protein